MIDTSKKIKDRYEVWGQCRENKIPDCDHKWELGVGGWGVVIGISRCEHCHVVANQSHFETQKQENENDR